MSTPARKVFDRFRKSMLTNTDDWKSLVGEDVSLVGPLAQSTGKADFLAINEPFFSSIRGGVLHTVVEADDYLITRITTEVLMPSGEIISLEVCEWYKIVDGRIVSLRVYFDTAEMLKHLQPPG